ncbi:hypothetical protein BJX62DRAFT_242870 [Aspergillus germanicus]
MPLTDEQKQQWLDHDFIRLPQCFSREVAQNFTSSIWSRLGISPTDKSTWTSERINMPGHTVVSVSDFAPKAWEAICELVGGEDRVADWCKGWRDSWNINLGKPEYKPEDLLDVRTLDNWHNDGDWFTHFLDSGEQAMLVIPLFSDIKPKGGGTVICTDGIRLVAKHLYLLHPFMLHSASRNLRRVVRIITNPPVTLKEPFNYNRPDGQYSLVEQKTLRDLGRDAGLPEWQITGERMLVPARVQIQEGMRREEAERLSKAGVPVTKLASAKTLDSYYPS